MMHPKLKSCHNPRAISQKCQQQKNSKPRSDQMNLLSFQPAIRQTDTKGYQRQKISQFVKSCQYERHLKSIYPEKRRCEFLSEGERMRR